MSTGGQDHIGPYRLLKLLRSGHSCQVWEAINATDDCRVAIKSLQRDQSSNDEAVAGLKHEYAVGHELANPNIIRIYDVSTDRGVAYLVLELFRGPNLKQAMRLGPERIRYWTTHIIRAAAEGLHHLHQKGWIHCDIKPDNFLINDDAEIKLIDFSIAQRPRRGLARWLAGKTKVQGTLSYMSPEQIRGDALDYRSDIYSFGCLLYELVAGKLPFTGTSSDDLLTKHLRASVPSLLSVNPAVTKDFSQLVASMMSKDPADRPATMKDFLDAFEKIRVFRVRPSPPADPSKTEG